MKNNICFRTVASALLVCGLSLFLCCTQQTQRADASGLQSPQTGVFAIPTTAMEVKPIELPPPFKLKTETVGTESDTLQATLFYPVSEKPEYAEFDSLVVQLAHSKTADYSVAATNGKTGAGGETEAGSDSETPSDSDARSVLEFWVSDLSINGSLLGFCFTDQSYTQGAAHYDHNYSTLNYDTVSGKRVLLGDIFKLDTQANKSRFRSLADSDDGSNGEGGGDSVETSDLSPDRDFLIKDGTVVLYFDDFEKGPSMETISFAIEKVRELLKPAYLWLADL